MNQKRIEELKAFIVAKVSKGNLPHPERLEFLEDVEEEGHNFIQQWYRKIYNFDFYDTEEFEELIFHSPGEIQINNGAHTLFDSSDLTNEDFQLALEVMCLKRSIDWNLATPFASFDIALKNTKLRATLLHHSLSGDKRSKLFLRKHAPQAFPLESFSEEAAFLLELVKKRKNVLVSGATGSGKTSLLNSMLAKSCLDDHLIILEDTLELLSPSETATRLLARQGEKEDLKEYMAYAMRMSPDRIVLGELRSAEAEPFLLAMNSGHRGLLSTIHSNGAADAISRLSLLIRFYAKNPLDYNLVTDLVCQNIDYVIHVENKRATEIIEVFGSEGGQIFYEKKAA